MSESRSKWRLVAAQTCMYTCGPLEEVLCLSSLPSRYCWAPHHKVCSPGNLDPDLSPCSSRDWLGFSSAGRSVESQAEPDRCAREHSPETSQSHHCHINLLQELTNEPEAVCSSVKPGESLLGSECSQLCKGPDLGTPHKGICYSYPTQDI